VSLLAGLDAIDWRALSHGAGSAQAMPALLRALIEGPERDRDEVLIELFDVLVNDGLVYSATAAVVPFLVAIARSPATTCRPEVLDLLGRIVRASAFPEVDDPVRARDEIRDGVEMPVQAQWALASKAAVGRHEGAWVELLDDPDAAVRGAAAFVLSGLDVLSRRSVQALSARAASERDDAARASMLLSLAEADVADVSAILSSAMKHGVRVVRLACAVGLGRIGFPSELEASVDLLIAVIRAPDDYEAEWGQVAGTDNVATDAREALVTLAPEQARLVLGPLLGALAADSCDIYQALRAVLELTFPEQGRTLTREALSAVQRGALERIAMTTRLWEDASDRHVLQRYFRARGLPGTRAELRWFLGA